MAQPAPFAFKLSLPGQPAYTVMLQRFLHSIADWRPFWQDYFAPLWYRHVETTYATQGTAVGTPWEPLSTSYAAWKEKHWPGLPIGVLSGTTREALTVPGDAYGIWRASGTSLTVGARVPWALYQQVGTRRMPARAPLVVGREFMLEVGRLLNTYAHDVKKASA